MRINTGLYPGGHQFKPGLTWNTAVTTFVSTCNPKQNNSLDVRSIRYERGIYYLSTNTHLVPLVHWQLLQETDREAVYIL